MAVMVTGEVVTRLQISAAYPPSEAVINCVQAMDGERTVLAALQQRKQVFAPLEIDLRLAGALMHYEKYLYGFATLRTSWGR